LQFEVQTIKCLTHVTYHRDLCFTQHVQFIQIFLFSKLRYVAQNMPITDEAARHISVTISWYLWSGAIFQFTLFTLTTTLSQQNGSKHGCLSSSLTTHQICARYSSVSTTSHYTQFCFIPPTIQEFLGARQRKILHTHLRAVKRTPHDMRNTKTAGVTSRFLSSSLGLVIKKMRRQVCRPTVTQF
jgi:hypothetical protein